MALAGALFVSGADALWLPIAGLLVLVALSWRRSPDPAEAAFTRRWVFPATLGVYAGAGVYFFTGQLGYAGAAGCAVVAAVWLGLYLHERVGRPS
jgi:hypothetical protein